MKAEVESVGRAREEGIRTRKRKQKWENFSNMTEYAEKTEETWKHGYIYIFNNNTWVVTSRATFPKSKVTYETARLLKVHP